MSSVTLPGTGGTVTFKYDPFGRRIYKSSTSGTSIYAYDGVNLIEEANSSGAAVARYAQTDNIDEPIATLRAGATNYYEADGLGSITSLSNAAGTVAQSYTFDSFGNQTAASGSLTNPFRYTGREFDIETSLYFYRTRYFDPAAGRFLTEDPLEFAGGRNFYAYTRNDPVILADPSGMTPTQGNVVAPLMPGDTAGFFIANLEDPRLKALFPSGSNAPWPEGTRHYGESPQCVAFTKFFTGLPCSGCWRAGPKVVGNNIPPGTAIATFDDQGLYPNKGHGNNSGIYVGLSSPPYPPNSIMMLDLWPGHNASARTVKPTGATASDQSGAYSVITVPYGTKSSCGKCGNW
jgi:RHS repeat-associated protein